jgi:hypothetical protein
LFDLCDGNESLCHFDFSIIDAEHYTAFFHGLPVIVEKACHAISFTSDLTLPRREKPGKDEAELRDASIITHKPECSHFLMKILTRKLAKSRHLSELTLSNLDIPSHYFRTFIPECAKSNTLKSLTISEIQISSENAIALFQELSPFRLVDLSLVSCRLQKSLVRHVKAFLNPPGRGRSSWVLRQLKLTGNEFSPADLNDFDTDVRSHFKPGELDQHEEEAGETESVTEGSYESGPLDEGGPVPGAPPEEDLHTDSADLGRGDGRESRDYVVAQEHAEEPDSDGFDAPQHAAPAEDLLDAHHSNSDDTGHLSDWSESDHFEQVENQVVSDHGADPEEAPDSPPDALSGDLDDRNDGLGGGDAPNGDLSEPDDDLQQSNGDGDAPNGDLDGPDNDLEQQNSGADDPNGDLDRQSDDLDLSDGGGDAQNAGIDEPNSGLEHLSSGGPSNGDLGDQGSDLDPPNDDLVDLGSDPGNASPPRSPGQDDAYDQDFGSDPPLSDDPGNDVNQGKEAEDPELSDGADLGVASDREVSNDPPADFSSDHMGDFADL